MTALRITCLLLCSLMMLTTSRAAPADTPEKAQIEALIQSIETLKDATFIRNGSSYEAKTAAKFLRGKWDSKVKEITTAMEFIEKVASESSSTGKPYLIRFTDGHEVKCGEFLKAALARSKVATK